MEREEDIIIAQEGQLDDEVAESPTTEVPLDAQRFPRSFAPAFLEGLRAQDLATLQATDAALVEKGMHAFFNNDFREAEGLFAAHYCQDCLVASAYGTLGTIRALLSMEQADVDEACQRLLFASNFAQQVSPPERMVTKTIAAVTSSMSSAFSKASGFLGSWGKTKGGESPAPAATPSPTASPSSIKRLTVAQFRAEVVHAESEVLRATLLLLQDSFAAYVKAGLALRRSYNAYARLQQYIQERTPEEEAALDRNSVEGVHFGLGCIHVVTSILPPKILAILKALGYMHNRDIGFEHLQRSLRSGTLRSPLASLFMLAFHGILPSFALVMIPDSLPTCAAVMAENQKQFPVSVIHLWLGGRVARLSRDCSTSMDVLTRCLDQGKHLMADLPQLQHFALYDQAWNWCTTFDWLAAATAFEHLEKESNWSKKMFSYAQGCCYEMLAVACALHASPIPAFRQTAASIVSATFFDESSDQSSNTAALWASKASAAYLRAHNHAATRLGGKVISIDQFVGRRLTTMLERQGCTASSPSSPVVATTAPIRNVVALSGFELLLVFNMLSQAPVASLKAIASATAVVGAMVLGRDELAPAAICKTLLTRGDVGEQQLAGANDVPPGMLLPCYRGETAVALLMLADCTRDGGGVGLPEARFQTADLIYSALVDPTVFSSKSGSEEIKWCAPFAYYGRAMCRYWDAASKQPASADTVLQAELTALKQAYSRVDYHFEMQMQFRLHLTQDFLRHRVPAKSSSS